LNSVKKPFNDISNRQNNRLSDEDRKLFFEGISQFNERKFFQCHETLEKIWLKQKGSEKEALQALIQLAVAYHHFLKGNRAGALKLLNRALPRLNRHQPTALGIAFSELSLAVQSNIELLSNCPDFEGQQMAIPRVRCL
jgi:predicted metal-dependent hydrolase